MSLRLHNSKTTRPNFTKFLCMLPVAVTGPPLAALWNVIYFRFYGWRHFHNMGPMGHNEARRHI